MPVHNRNLSARVTCLLHQPYIAVHIRVQQTQTEVHVYAARTALAFLRLFKVYPMPMQRMAAEEEKARNSTLNTLSTMASACRASIFFRHEQSRVYHSHWCLIQPHATFWIVVILLLAGWFAVRLKPIYDMTPHLFTSIRTYAQKDRHCIRAITASSGALLTL